MLIKNTFVLPFYLLMLAIILIIVGGDGLYNLLGGSSGNPSFAGAFDYGSRNAVSGNLAVLLNFLIIIIAINGALKVSQSFAGGVAAKSTAWAQKTLGTGVGAGIRYGAPALSFVGRNTLGRGGRVMSNSAWAQNLAASNNKISRYAGRAAIRTGDAVSKSSMDVRGGKFGKAMGATFGAGLSAAGIKTKTGRARKTGGYEDDRRQTINKRLKRARALNEDAREAYADDLEQRGVWSTVTGNTEPNRDAADRIRGAGPIEDIPGGRGGGGGGGGVDMDDFRAAIREELDARGV